mgnify:CR=1 FL=1
MKLQNLSSQNIKRMVSRFHNQLLLSFCFRILNSFLLFTFFQPDEYYQAWEPAYIEMFHRGYKTWEWHAGLRTSLLPRFFTLIIRIAEILNINYLVLGKIVMAFVAALADVYTGKVAETVTNSREIGIYTWLISLGSMFNWYCSTRTFSNTLEMALTIVAFYVWAPTKTDYKRISWIRLAFAQLLAHISIALRPSAGIFWLHIGIYSIFMFKGWKERVNYSLFSFLVALICQTSIVLLDLDYYSPDFKVPYLEFFRFNVLYKVSSLYGENEVYWYITQGVTFLLMGYIPYFILGWRKTPGLIKQIIVVNLSLMSLISHKEQRFLFFLLPFMHISTAIGFEGSRRSVWAKLKPLAVLVNVVVALYLSIFHMGGVSNVVETIRKDNSIKEVAFLMPCHATPWHSHFQRQDAEFNPLFLSCEPPWKQYIALNNPSFEDEDLLSNSLDSYKTETELFYEDPSEYLSQHPELITDTIVVYEPLQELMESHGYAIRDSFFNGLFTDDERKSGHILIMSKD